MNSHLQFTQRQRLSICGANEIGEAKFAELTLEFLRWVVRQENGDALVHSVAKEL